MSSDQPEPTATETPAGDSGGAVGDRPRSSPATTDSARSDSAGLRREAAGAEERGVAACLRDDRALSYALGFVVVFSVAVAGTLALFVAGVDLLSDVDRDGAIAAGEANVDVVHSEIGDMVAQGDERRTFQFELVDAQLRVTDSEVIEMRVESDDVALDGVEYATRALRYAVPPHDTTFVYALGHLYRVDERGDGSARSEQPPLFEVSDRQTRLVVPVLTGSTPGGPTEIGVTGTGERDLVALQSGSRASLTRTGTGGTNASAAGVGSIAGTLTVEGVAHPSVWVTALETTGFDDVQVGAEGTTVTGTFESDRLTLQRADIAFALGGEASR
jgi:hypothetical protein